MESKEVYKEVFSNCISEAEPRVAKHLAYILVRLQIHRSRLKSLYDEFSPGGDTVQISSNNMSYIFCLGELVSLNNQMFSFARGKSDFDDSPLTEEQLSSTYNLLDIDVEFIDGLKGFTSRNHAKRWN